MEQDLTVIQNFNVLPAQSLELLRQKLQLQMSRTELLYCARHYNNRGKGEISVDELRFIDALACPACVTLDKIAIGELLTDHAHIAETYADAVSKLKALGKTPDKPYTLQDVASLSSRYVFAVKQKDITEPVGIFGTPTLYFSKGLDLQFPIASEKGCFDVLRSLPLRLQARADYADTLVLLCPQTNMASGEFDSAVAALLQDDACKNVHCICNTESESIAHAMLRISSGAVLNIARLPMMQNLHDLSTPCKGVLVSLAQYTAPALIQAAQARGLHACEFGLIDHAGYLLVKNGKDTLLSLDIPYLKSICFIRSYTLRAEDKTVDVLPRTLSLSAPEDATDESCNAQDAVLRTLPPLRVRTAAAAQETSFRAAMFCALKAYCTAVAAGCEPERIWLDVAIAQDSQAGISHAASDLLCALLGLYRFSMESGVPVHTNTAFAAEQSLITALASAPADMVIPERLQGQGRIYLLSPRYREDGMPCMQELRNLIAYLRRAMLGGKIKSARVICGSTPADQLTAAATDCSVILNPHGMQVLDTPCPCGFIVEADGELDGDLIAVSAQPENAQNHVISDNNS